MASLTLVWIEKYAKMQLRSSEKGFIWRKSF